MGLKRRWRILAVLGVTALVFSGCTDSTVIPEEDLPSITARGVGEATGVPDTVIVVLGVETQASQAAEALASNNESSAAVIDELKSAGVADEDIKTSHFSISPVFGDDREVPPDLPPPPDGRRGEITGYSVTNLVTARISTDDADAGDLIDAAAEAAGDDIRVQSVRFEIDDTSGLYAEARADAVERAKEQAEQLAESAGVELGDVRSITEESTGGFPPIPRAEFEHGIGGGAGGPGFEPGSQELTLQVELVYEISN